VGEDVLLIGGGSSGPARRPYPLLRQRGPSPVRAAVAARAGPRHRRGGATQYRVSGVTHAPLHRLACPARAAAGGCPGAHDPNKASD